MDLPPIHPYPTRPGPGGKTGTDPVESGSNSELGIQNISTKCSSDGGSNGAVVRRERPIRACTTRPIKYLDPPVMEPRSRALKRERVEKMVVEDVDEIEDGGGGKEVVCNGGSRVMTSLVNVPTNEQLPRWNLRSMWELASVLNFFHIFKPLLNITVEFSAEELETSLLMANTTLGEIHVPLLKAIPPITRMPYGHDTWIIVLCRKLRDWWHWVAEGDLPIIASQGAEIEVYKNLNPGVRLVILKALCDIRVEQDDIRTYIDTSLKHGHFLSAFRKQRIGGDSHGVSYWYEEDEMIGHRLYREIRKVDKKFEVKNGKTKGSHTTSYEWETVATNLDEFVDVSEKLLLSNNRTEVSVGKKLKNIMIPDIESIHKRREKLLRKQQREALLLDNFATLDGLATGRSLRDRKRVTYTFDDFDRSINEAIKITKRKHPSPEPTVRREVIKSEPSANGRWNGPSHASLRVSFSPPSINFSEMNEDHYSRPLDRSRQRPRRYSGQEFAQVTSENEKDFESDDEIVGEVVYDEEYLRQRKQKKKLGNSKGEGNEEYHWSDENGEDEEGDSPSMSDDSDQPRSRFKRYAGRTLRRTTRSKSSGPFDRGLRRSKRATRSRVNYKAYEVSESDNEFVGQETLDGTYNANYSIESQRSDDGNDDVEQKMGYEPGSLSRDDDDDVGVGKRRFLDLNEVAPGSSFEDGPSAFGKDVFIKGE